MEEVIFKKIKDIKLDDTPIFIGIHGPQGCGKSTSCKNIKNKLTSYGFKVCIISIDDFYYPYDEMNKILTTFNDPLYSHRGMAGTHDTEQLYSCLERLQCGMNTEIPIFNKEFHNGRGDRTGYLYIENNMDVIIIEGWMIGYKQTDVTPNELVLFNNMLSKYNRLNEYINLWFYIKAENIDFIYDWRLSAEKGMNKIDFDNFMIPYMNVYKHYNIDSNDNVIVLNKYREIIRI
tara:strand:- start:72 stop:770 length:699 start_codon:yes stop_codon:yes gene_type:complete